MAILKESYEEAKRLLSENRDALDKIAAFLIEKETITGKEFMKIFREVKGIPEPEEESGKTEPSEKTEKSKESEKMDEEKPAEKAETLPEQRQEHGPEGDPADREEAGEPGQSGE